MYYTIRIITLKGHEDVGVFDTVEEALDYGHEYLTGNSRWQIIKITE